MAKIAILLPRDEMLQPVARMAQEHHLDVLEIAAIHTSTALQKAKELEDRGADIVIARGIQAMLIRQHTALPVVEIQLTGQEIGLLILKASSIVKKASPVIAVIGFANMFSDMTSFGEMFNVNLHTYFVENTEDLRAAAEQAIHDGTDILIGGDTVCACATEQHTASVFISSSGESIGEACRFAKHMAYAIDIEKQNTSEFRAILDYTINGIIQLDSQGLVRHMNYSAEQHLQITEANAIGKPLTTWVSAIDESLLAPLFQDGKEIVSVRFELADGMHLASISPILTNDAVTGAIFCIHEGKQLALYAAAQRQELFSHGYQAIFTFDMLQVRSVRMKKIIE